MRKLKNELFYDKNSYHEIVENWFTLLFKTLSYTVQYLLSNLYPISAKIGSSVYRKKYLKNTIIESYK